MKAYTSHQLARKLLDLANKPVVVVTGGDGQYTDQVQIGRDPWEDSSGNVRFMAEDLALLAACLGVKPELEEVKY